jgi:hypothetical protein
VGRRAAERWFLHRRARTALPSARPEASSSDGRCADRRSQRSAEPAPPARPALPHDPGTRHPGPQPRFPPRDTRSAICEAARTSSSSTPPRPGCRTTGGAAKPHGHSAGGARDPRGRRRDRCRPVRLRRRRAGVSHLLDRRGHRAADDAKPVARDTADAARPRSWPAGPSKTRPTNTLRSSTRRPGWTIRRRPRSADRSWLPFGPPHTESGALQLRRRLVDVPGSPCPPQRQQLGHRRRHRRIRSGTGASAARGRTRTPPARQDRCRWVRLRSFRAR